MFLPCKGVFDDSNSWNTITGRPHAWAGGGSMEVTRTAILVSVMSSKACLYIRLGLAVRHSGLLCT